MVKVAISGYFDPIHVGHLEFIKKSKELGDYLIVIVNNDLQSNLKKGKSFMNEDDRVEIIKSIRWVDEVFLSIDNDASVEKSLKVIKPNIFTNGGDRFNDIHSNEYDICKKYNIKLIDGLGDKIRSSSEFTGIYSKG